MKNFPALLICAGVSVSLLGCAERWEKPGASQEEYEITEEVCTNEATAKFPPDMRVEQADDGYMTPEYTTCSGKGPNLGCRSVGGRYVPPTVTAVDDNMGPRNQAFRACLMEKGWLAVRE